MPSLVAPLVSGLPAAQPSLGAGDLLLRPWHDDDAPALVDVYSDPGVRQWHAESLDDTEAAAYAERWAGLYRTASRVGWAVVREGRLAGRVTLSRLRLSDGQAEVTYWTAPHARGAGLAPRAVEAVAGWARAVGFQRLELSHSTQNPSSCRVAEKTGFVLEGTRRRAALHPDGLHDMHLHARLL